MRPGCDLDFSPGQVDIGVMTLLFRQLANQIDEPKSLTEIRKLEQLRNVVLVDGAPTVHPLLERCELLALQRWHASAAGDAEFAGQVRHNLRHCSTEARDWRCKADRNRRPPVGRCALANRTGTRNSRLKFGRDAAGPPAQSYFQVDLRPCGPARWPDRTPVAVG